MYHTKNFFRRTVQMYYSLTILMSIVFSFTAVAQPTIQKFQTEQIIPSQNFNKSFQNQLSKNSLFDPIIGDFQVNENAGDTDQSTPVVAIDGRGCSVFVWRDNRSGEPDIYAQCFSSNLEPIGTDFRVNDDEGSAWQYNPVVATDKNGNFIVTWEDCRNDDQKIFAQVYSSAGTKVDDNFPVCSDDRFIESSADVACDIDGNYLVTWNCRDIYAQQIAQDGTKIGDKILVVADEGDYNPVSPAVVALNNRNFIFTWEAHGPDNYDHIYVQIFSNNGTPIGDIFEIDDNKRLTSQHAPDIAADDSGNFIIIWKDYMLEPKDIYAQRFSYDGIPIGDNIKINDEITGISQGRHSISADSSGNFFICWTDARDGNFDIYGQWLFVDGTKIGDNIKINDDTNQSRQDYPNSFMDKNGNTIVTWTDGRFFNTDIFAQKFRPDSNKVGANFKVNGSEGGAHQSNPAIDVDGNGNFVVVWTDYRSGGDVFAQMFLTDGSFNGNNFLVNNQQESGHSTPAIAVNQLGDFIITWHNERNISAQRYKNDGTPIGGNFRVDNDYTRSLKNKGVVEIDDQGNFVIAWGDQRNGNWDIYAQWYSSAGSAIGSNFRVNDDDGTTFQLGPSIVTKNGQFIIVWTDNRDGYQIFGQRFQDDGTLIGKNFQIGDEEGWGKSGQSISIDSEGNFVVAWKEQEIYAVRYSFDGRQLGSNFKVNDVDGSVHEWWGYPSASMGQDGNFVIVWRDERNGDPDIYGQLYSNEGIPLGKNFNITTGGSAEQREQDGCMWNNRIYTTWADNRAGDTGYDIWMNVLDFDDPGLTVKDIELDQIPSKTILSQNYPNPFNSKTIINYELTFSAAISIAVYDVLGNLMVNLIEDETRDAGNYSINFDASHLSSGIYFYRIQAKYLNGKIDFEMNKMVVIK